MAYTRKPGPSDPYARYFPTPGDRGYLAETMPGYAIASSSIPSVAGRLEFARLKVPIGVPVTNIVMHVVTAGSTLTSGQCFAVLFDAACNKIGVTADQATAWASGGTKTMALASGPFQVSTPYAFVGFWYNGTTSPAWARGGSISAAPANGTQVSPNLWFGTADTGLTTTAPAKMAGQAAGSATWWVALN
jgi:hypothetical protein